MAKAKIVPISRNQAGHFHLVVALIIVAVVVGAIGWFVYLSNKPSNITDASFKAQLKQTSQELKQTNLAQVKQATDTVSGVKTSFDYSKANGK